jgi:hypothetical protein
MKKIALIVVVMTVIGIANKTEAQVRWNVNVGIGVPVAPPVVVYNNPYPVYPAGGVVVVRDRDDYRCHRDYDDDRYYRRRECRDRDRDDRYRELPGRRNGWYKNHGRDRD